MTKKIATTWTKGLDEQEVIHVREHFLTHKPFRDRMIKLLRDKIDSKRREVRNAENYDKPHWDKYLADSIGYERGMMEIISLLEGYEEK